MTRPMDETRSGSEGSVTGRSARMRRAPGGRHQRLVVRLTEEEERQIRQRADEKGLSAQRFVIEAALSGSAQSAAARRHAAVEVRAARVILKGLANNLNQLTKWANTNHALPAYLERLMDDLHRAVLAVERTAGELGMAFASNDQVRGGGDTEVSS
jgi:uncharacterized protein (DUF1778 family)